MANLLRVCKVVSEEDPTSLVYRQIVVFPVK